MANDYTNTAEHYIPVPAITDQWNFTRDITNLRTRLNKGMAGMAAYDASASNYILAAANAGSILSSAGVAPRGRIIGAASGQDPQLSFQLNTGAALATAWTFGVDDSDADKLKIEYAATLGSATPAVSIQSTGQMGIGVAAPVGWLHAKAGASGVTAAPGLGLNTAGIIESDTHTGLAIFCPSGYVGALLFSDANATASGRIWYDHTNEQMQFIVGGSERIRIAPAGNLLLGTTTSPSSAGTKALVLGDNAGEPVLGVNTAAFYAADVLGTVEAFAVDEAGNQVQLTQHDETTGEVIHRSVNVYTGREMLILIEQMAKELERLTGTRFFVETQRPAERRRDWNAVQAGQRTRREQEIAAWDEMAATGDAIGDRPTEHAVKPAPPYIRAAMEASR